MLVCWWVDIECVISISDAEVVDGGAGRLKVFFKVKCSLFSFLLCWFGLL